MPLPIETPAPKASSLIKRFQQTIDSLDGNQSLPSHKQLPHQVSHTRRSASAGTPPLFRSPQLGSLNRSSWNSPSDFDPSNPLSRLPTADTLTQPDPQIPAALSDHPARLSPHSSLTPADLKHNQTHQSFHNSVPSRLELPAAPPIDQPSDISKLSDLFKSDLAVQSPVSISKTSQLPLSSDHPKPKASISADVPQAVRPRKVTNHITAPTAASLAKMRDSQVSRSNSQTKDSSTKTGSVKAPLRPHATGHVQKNGGDQLVTKPVGSPKLPTAHDMATGTATIRQTSSSSAPKERAKMQQVRPSTPATTHALKRSVIAKTKAPPLPLPATIDKALLAHTPSAPVKATTRRVVTADSQKPNKSNNPSSQSVGHTNTSKKSETRPLQRARVASAATPISGIRKSPNLKSTSQASDCLPVIAKPASENARKSPDLRTTSSKHRPVTQASRSAKSSKQATILFADTSSTSKNNKITTTNKEGHLPVPTKKKVASQEPNENYVETESVRESELQIHTEQAEKEPVLTKFKEPTDDQDRVVRSGEDEAKENHQVEKQETIFKKSETGGEDRQIEPIASSDAHYFDHEDNEIIDQKPVVGLIGSIVVDPTQVSQKDDEEINVKDEQSFSKHTTHISLSGISLKSDDDQSKGDFDASTTTNTDVDAEE